MTTAQVKLYAQDGSTLTGTLARVRGVRTQFPLNDVPILTFQLHNTDPLFPDCNPLRVVELLLDYSDGNGYVSRGKFMIDRTSTTVRGAGEAAAQWTTVTAKGVECWLDDAVVDDEDTDYARLFDDRWFGFMTSDWLSYDPADWAAPVTQAPGAYPDSWPENDTLSQLIWPVDPYASGTDGVYRSAMFRRAFTLASPTLVRIAATANDNFIIWLKGERILSQTDQVLQWGNTYTMDVWLPAGTHHLAARVWDSIGAESMFICSVNKLDGTTRETYDPPIVYTGDASWECHDETTDGLVGMTTGEVLDRMLTEAQSRGEIPYLTWDFTDAIDSRGIDWPKTLERSLRVGDSLLDVCRQFAEAGGFYFHVTSGLVLKAYQERGTDRGYTPVDPQCLFTSNLLEHTVDKIRPDKTRLLVRTEQERAYQADTVAEGLYGRRVGYVELGNVASRGQAEDLAAGLFEGRSVPTRQITSSVLLTTGVRPFVDFDLGDTVGILDEEGNALDAKVVAVTISQDDNRLIFVPEYRA